MEQSDPAAGLSLGDLQVTPLRRTLAPPDGSDRFLWPSAGARPVSPPGSAGTVEFRTDVFDAASIETLIERLERVLVAITADPTRRLSSMDVLDEA